MRLAILQSMVTGYLPTVRYVSDDGSFADALDELRHWLVRESRKDEISQRRTTRRAGTRFAFTAGASQLVRRAHDRRNAS
jgi:hypothetical protein